MIVDRRIAVLALAAALGLPGCGGGPGAPVDPPAAETPQDPVELETFDFGGDFTLTDHTGEPFHLEDLRGKVVLAFFGYTTCPDFCPLTMSTIATALRSLGLEDSDDVVTLFVSVDLEHDTPPVLAQYVESYGVPMVGLTGSKAQIDEVVAQYRGAYQITPTPDSALPYQVSHTTYTYLIDPEGRLRYVFRYGEPPERIAEGVTLLLDPAST